MGVCSRVELKNHEISLIPFYPILNSKFFFKIMIFVHNKQERKML